MLNPAEDLYMLCIEFLEQDDQQRLQVLKKMGLARYNFLTKIPFTDANVTCVMRFLGNRRSVKFPNLQGADLSGLVLDNVNFIRANLTAANLKNTRLINGDLLFANFSYADLTNADLSGATLNETIWLGAIVEGCNFTNTTGLTSEQCRDLKSRGAKI